MKRILYILMAALGVASCIYPYDEYPDNVSESLVIEGDIIVGGESSFLLTYMQKLSDTGIYQTVTASVWVEDEDGRTYPGTYSSSSYSVDLSSASSEKEYRLRVETPDGKNYASQWGRPEGSCELDNLKYIKDEDQGQLKLAVNLHSDGSSRHFRYRYFEDWEYHTYRYAYMYYDPAQDTVLKYENFENTYYCWRSSFSRGLNLATTEKMSEDRLDDYVFKTIGKTEERLSMLYRIRLEVYPVSAESYAYYENVKDVSSPTGDLFSPIPSEVRGNIRNMNDDSEMVYGYVAVVTPRSATIYYDDEVEKFYQVAGRIEYEEFAVEPDKFKSYYRKNYLPVTYDPMEGFIWGPKKCLDCRTAGGTKNKPADWPRDDK